MTNIGGNDALREISENEIRKWKPQRISISISIIEKFLDSKMKMAEVNLEKLKNPSPRKGSNVKSTKQDSFASSFYSWKKKKNTKEKLQHLGINILLIRRGGRVALKKIPK